jgi:hypothetical protein
MRPLPFGNLPTKKLRLLFADFHVVERQIQIDIGIANQAVVGDHGHADFVRHFNGARHRHAVVRHNDEYLCAGSEQRFHVADLLVVVGVGRLHFDFGAQFLCAFHEQVAVGLPARFFQGIERQADNWCCRSGRAALDAGLPTTRNDKSDENAQRQGNHHQYVADVHRAPLNEVYVFRSCCGYGIRLTAAGAL